MTKWLFSLIGCMLLLSINSFASSRTEHRFIASNTADDDLFVRCGNAVLLQTTKLVKVPSRTQNIEIGKIFVQRWERSPASTAVADKIKYEILCTAHESNKLLGNPAIARETITVKPQFASHGGGFRQEHKITLTRDQKNNIMLSED